MISSSRISIESGFLCADGSHLRASVLDIPDSSEIPVSAEELKHVLHLGRKAISNAPFYRLWTIRLGDTDQTDGRDSQVYTVAGYATSGVLTEIDEIQEPFRDYWRTIEDAGFIAEVRSTIGDGVDGSWMLLGHR